MIPPEDKWRGQAEMLVNRVRKNQRRLKSWLRQHNVSCYRVYNLDIPEIPLLVDWYEGRLHVGVKLRGEFDAAEENRWVRHLAEELARALALSEENVFIKFRRQGRGGAQYAPVASDARIFEVSEGGYRFTVNLSDYLDTGLFPDHRLTRRMVEKEAVGKRFLNLFAYTGAFTVYAAGGGAVATTTIDLSNTYLEAARQNMITNGFTGGTHRYLKHDVLALLNDENWRDQFDLVVMDAPTVSVSKSMERRLAIQKDYVWMLNQVLNRVSDGGVIYFSCNLSSFRFDAEQVQASAVEEISHRTIPPDYAGKPPHSCFRIVK